jgi:RHS repeat-associated protein
MRVAVYDGTDLEYFATDHLGSTVLVMDDTGTKLSEQRYLPFGEVRTDVGTAITQTDFGFTGQRNNTYIKLIDYGARWYSSALGRFTQPDTIIPSLTNSQSYNRYSYVNNDPVNFTDPSGHLPIGDDDDDVCLPGSDCNEDVSPWAERHITRVNEELLDPNDGNSGISGRDFYDWYLWLYRQYDGWWWDFFGGEFSIYDAMAMVLIGEGSGHYRRGGVSTFLFAEAGYREIVDRCMSIGGNSADYCNSTEGLINRFAMYMASAGERANPNKGFGTDPDPHHHRNFGSYERSWTLRMSFLYEHPRTNWMEGCKPGSPCGFGNRIGNSTWWVDKARAALIADPENYKFVKYNSYNNIFLIVDYDFRKELGYGN